MSLRRGRLLLAFAVQITGALALCGPAWSAEFNVRSLDRANEGFDDPSPPDAAAALGDNPGETLGEQRRIAFEFAADVWGALLDSPIVVQVDTRMHALECDENGAVLGAAAATYLFWDPASELWYPSALADAVMGEDLDPGEPDIDAEFNSELDAGCFDGTRWYYGLDGNAGLADVDFLSVVLHELAHGLGFISFVDYTTGEFPDAAPDVFGSLILDAEQGRSWAELSEDELVSSARNVRNLVWAGAQVTQVAPTMLASGTPVLALEPAVAGFSGVINETNLGPTVLEHPAAGPLVVLSDGCNLPEDLDGAAVLLSHGECDGPAAAEARGAVLVLYDAGTPGSPPGDLNLHSDLPVSIPVVHVSAGDAERLADANRDEQRWVTLSADPQRLLGADDQGRVLLNATSPIEEGSSIFHWDSLTRRTNDLSLLNRDLLMEPAGLTAGSQLDLTVALLSDLGWSAQVCGDDQLTRAETCDDGAGNSDLLPDACRSDCQPARCGDAIVDTGELCDEGASNGARGSRCLRDCTPSSCGDGEQQPGEACDDGADNSDTLPGACRRDCQSAACGDGVLDPGEVCEPGNFGPSDAGVSCSAGCTLGRCGDGVHDPTEGCDEGAANAPGERCLPNCELNRCGDGIQDPAEACDRGARNSDTRANACRTDCRLAHCGDGVIDSGEHCDDANQAGADGCSAECTTEPMPVLTGGHATPPVLFDAAAAPTSPLEPPAADAAAPDTAADTTTADAGNSSHEGTAEVPDAAPGGPHSKPDAASVNQSNSLRDESCGCRAVGSEPTHRALQGVQGLLLAALLLRARRRR